MTRIFSILFSAFLFVSQLEVQILAVESYDLNYGYMPGSQIHLIKSQKFIGVPARKPPKVHYGVFL